MADTAAEIQATLERRAATPESVAAVRSLLSRWRTKRDELGVTGAQSKAIIWNCTEFVPGLWDGDKFAMEKVGDDVTKLIRDGIRMYVAERKDGSNHGDAMRAVFSADCRIEVE